MNIYFLLFYIHIFTFSIFNFFCITVYFIDYFNCWNEISDVAKENLVLTTKILVSWPQFYPIVCKTQTAFKSSESEDFSTSIEWQVSRMLFPPAGYITVPLLFKLNHREKQAVRPQVQRIWWEKMQGKNSRWIGVRWEGEKASKRERYSLHAVLFLISLCFVLLTVYLLLFLLVVFLFLVVAVHLLLCLLVILWMQPIKKQQIQTSKI